MHYSTAGVDWHPNLHADQNLITRGDLPRFVMDSYEECRGPPRLFLLDKYAYWVNVKELECKGKENNFILKMKVLLLYIFLKTGLMLRVLGHVWSATLIHHSLKQNQHPLGLWSYRFRGKRKSAKERYCGGIII